MVGDVILVRAAKPLVRILVDIGNVAIGAIGHCERWLQTATKCRHLGLGKYRITLDNPQRHHQKSYCRALLSEQIGQTLENTSVEVAVLCSVAIFVGYKLLEPRHRVALDIGRREELDTLWQPHNKTIGAEVCRVYHERNRELFVFVSIVDILLYGIEVVHHSRCDILCRIGVYHPVFVALHLFPAETCRIGTPAIILRHSTLCIYQRAESHQDKYQESFHRH